MRFGTVVTGISLLTAVAAQREINFEACDHTGRGKLKSITLTPCIAEPCRLKKGSEVVFGFKFTSDQDSANVHLQGTASGPWGLRIPMLGLQNDFCKIVKCPVKKGKDYTGTLRFKIATIPISRTVVKMKVVGDAGLSACFKFPVLLV